MNLSTGVDLVEIVRIREAIDCHGERFVTRIFTKAEQQECRGRVESLAARFAAKEATAKALGCGIGDVSWLDIEVIGDENHAPHIFLHGAGEQVARKLGLSNWSVSLSHTQNQAIAFVVAIGS
ncbi:MAG: holo-ACP synthase [Chloroflexi bacterium]|nr:holo-ACP synthase [Chloroflexota bacterium]